MPSRFFYIYILFQKTLTSWYSVRWTLGTSMLCVEGQISSYDTNVRTLLQKHRSSAGAYQFFAGEDLIVVDEVYDHRGTRD